MTHFFNPVPIVNHQLPPKRLVSIFGSQENGSCSMILSEVQCIGTSVLNDGHIPPLNGITSNQISSWAKKLFTLERPLDGRQMVVAFEVENPNHDRVELAVFNCPEMGISLPTVSVFFDSSFRPDRQTGNRDPGIVIIQQLPLSMTSCEHLLVFCLKYPPVPVPAPKHFINLVFPVVLSSANSTYVFLGEVTFRNGGSEPCDPTMPWPGILRFQ